MCCEPAVKISERSNGRISCNLKLCLAVQKNQQPFSLSNPLSISFFSSKTKNPSSQHQLPKTSRRSQQSPKYMGHPSMGWTLNNLPLQPSSGRPNIKGHQEDIPASLEQNSSLLRGTTFVNISAPFLLV